MASLRKKGKVWYFRFTDAEGVKRERKGCPDRRATEEMGRAAETEAAKLKAGLVDTKARRMGQAERRPLSDHLAEFVASLAAKSDDPKHVTQTKTYATRFLDIGPIERVSDLNPSVVSRVLATLKDRGLSPRTLNAHVTAIKALSRWLHRDGRSSDDPLATVGKFNEQADRRHDRRTIGIDEVRRLIQAARVGDPFRLISGPDRALCYRLAISTGLRYAEIASITPASFALEVPSPTVTVAAAYTKNGDPATLHLPHDLVDDLVAWLATKPPGLPVFPLPEKGAAMLRVDLDAAGIPYRDAAGLVFDFHALRCQHATLLDLAGVSPRVVQRMMRHSTLELTGRYTKPRAVDLERATAALPDLTSASARPDSLAMTGTDPIVPPIGDDLSHHLPTAGDGMGRTVAGSDAASEPNGEDAAGCKLLDQEALDAARRGLSASDVDAPRRTRTYNPLIKSQLLCQLS